MSGFLCTRCIRIATNISFLLLGREAEVEGNRVMMFGTDDHLKLLCQSPIWLGNKTKTIHYALILKLFSADGTFDKVPKIQKEAFYQLVSNYIYIK